MGRRGRHGRGRRTGARGLGLPPATRACLFDLDGVLTQTARVHAAAWKAMFDDYLRRRSEERGEPFVPFDARRDYDEHVDGRPRADGVRTFLAARGITLPDGSPDDPPERETVWGLGNRKNAAVLAMLREHGVEVYEGSVRYVDAARRSGLRCAVVSASANCRSVLAAAGIDGRFDAVVDGELAAREHLAGKPEPDTYLAAARLAGVAAGRAGHFGWVVGVDRVGQAKELEAHGADIVVGDLAELLGAR
jgi:beta-phosphoglucomutase-like phosphatase (HAD superfamily)